MALSLGVKLPGFETDHAPQPSARSRMNGDIPPFPNTPSWRGAQFKVLEQLYHYHFLPAIWRI
jgi:hypothetical protein